jgi:hypothetical protein
MFDAEKVSLTCDTCHEALTVPFADIPEDAPLSVVARAFLEQHRGCSISIQVRPAKQS